VYFFKFKIDVVFDIAEDVSVCIYFRLGWALGCLHFGHATLVNTCFTELFVKFYFTISIFVMVASLFTAVLIVHISLKGTLINAYPRRQIPKLLIMKVILCIYLYNSCHYMYFFTSSAGLQSAELVV